MELAKDSNDQIIASEAFTPELTEKYAERYRLLVKKLAGVLPANRVDIIKSEIVGVKITFSAFGIMLST